MEEEKSRIDCSRCERLKRKRKADYVFNVEGNKGITVIYLYLCGGCFKDHSSVTQARYKHLSNA